MNRIKALLPLGLFMGLALFLAVGLTRDPGVLPTEMLDKPFPDFTMSTLHDPGAVVTDEIMRGQVSLVNVFGSWCAACVQEHPKLVEIGQQGRVKMIGVNWRDDREKGQRWIAHYGDPYDVILFDDTSQLAIDLGVTGAPETFVVDRNGKIRYKHIGMVTDEVWSQTLWPLVKSLEGET